MIKKVILDTGINSAQQNMFIDKKLLSSIAKSKEFILHLYEWSSFSVTYGYFINLNKFFDLKKVSDANIELARRPTGGGIVFHHCDFAFSFLVPEVSKFFSQQNILNNYAFINEIVIAAFQNTFGKNVLLAKEEIEFPKIISKHFCMAQPTKYDIMLGEKKIGGAAQRKVSHGFLHQGSILLGGVSREIFETVLLESLSSIVYESHQNNSFSILGDKWTQSELVDAKKIFKESLKQIFLSEKLI